MATTSYLKRITAKAVPFKDGLHINREGGPSGPLNIEKARDWEITWDRGRAILLKTPRSPTPEGEDMPDKTGFRPELDWDRGGSNTGTLPNAPNAPIDKLNYVVKDRKITEENLVMSYLDRLACVLAKAPLSFKNVLEMVKALYPDLKMKFPKPPTYVWNPKKDVKEEDDKKSQKPEDADSDVDESAKLEPQKIKDRLKVKFPDLKWTLRMSDGVEEAELGFDDESTALFEIGAKANHLTLTYFEAPKGIELKYDDATPSEEDEAK